MVKKAKLTIDEKYQNNLRYSKEYYNNKKKLNDELRFLTLKEIIKQSTK